jgi:rod shape determining protein RodA
MRIQPSEIMKIAMPLMLAWYFHKYEAMLKLRALLRRRLLLLVPVRLIAKQPDLGTPCWSAPPVSTSSSSPACRGRSSSACWPLPRRRPLSLDHAARLPAQAHPDPDRPDHRPARRRLPHHPVDHRHRLRRPFGKGWLNGTQTHLEFIPERHTDFIFAVFSEEFGLLGNALLLVLYTLLIGRGLMIAGQCPTLFSRLLAGAITLGFFTYAFVNMGMVSGILPVVGVPLPFMSYGGTALVTLFLGIGILMSIHTHRMLVKK